MPKLLYFLSDGTYQAEVFGRFETPTLRDVQITGNILPLRTAAAKNLPYLTLQLELFNSNLHLRSLETIAYALPRLPLGNSLECQVTQVRPLVSREIPARRFLP